MNVTVTESCQKAIHEFEKSCVCAAVGTVSRLMGAVEKVALMVFSKLDDDNSFSDL